MGTPKSYIISHQQIKFSGGEVIVKKVPRGGGPSCCLGGAAPRGPTKPVNAWAPPALDAEHHLRIVRQRTRSSYASQSSTRTLCVCVCAFRCVKLMMRYKGFKS